VVAPSARSVVAAELSLICIGASVLGGSMGTVAGSAFDALGSGSATVRETALDLGDRLGAEWLAGDSSLLQTIMQVGVPECLF
jgi:hypothetical protein